MVETVMYFRTCTEESGQPRRFYSGQDEETALGIFISFMDNFKSLMQLRTGIILQQIHMPNAKHRSYVSYS